MSVVRLFDSASGAKACVAVNEGFNLYHFEVPFQHGTHSVLWAADGFELGQQRPSGSGIPILFPFPGRIAQGRFNWNGRTWELPLSDGRGNAIHGYVLNRPWRLVAQSESSVTGEFQASRDLPDWNSLWPSDYRITATYRLHLHQLHCEYLLENPGDSPLPYGFGAHPYFRVPMGGPSADDCVVTLPVAREWMLDNLIATGEVRAVTQPFENGVCFGQLHLDNVFGGLTYRKGRCTCSVNDPASGLQLELEFGPAFRELVVYNPPHRQAICIEPYTCVPGATQHLAPERGGESPRLDLGWRTLAPGAAEQLDMIVRVRKHAP